MKKSNVITNTEKRLLALLLSLIVIFVYWPAINGGFIFDDEGYVELNPLLRDRDGLVRIWSDLKSSHQYYPLTFTSFWIEFHLWQTWTMGYHLTNVILHIFNAFLLLRILQRLAIPGAWFAAAIFALHPVHVESVAWIAERKNVLSGAFYLLALTSYLRFSPIESSALYDRQQRWPYYSFALVFFACALLSKTATCSFPAVLLLLIWWKKGHLSLADCWPLLPMFVLGLLVSSVSAAIEWNPEVVGAAGSKWNFTIIERVLIAGRALWFYLLTLLWPTNLIFIYPRWTIDATVWWQYLFPVSFLICISIFACLYRKIGRAPIAGALFFVGTLLPMLGFLNFYFMSFSFVADHFQYLASIGPTVLIGSIVWQKSPLVGEQTLDLPLPFLCFALIPTRTFFSCLILLSLGTLTWKQAHIYKNAETLWLETLQRNPTTWVAYNNLATEFSKAKEFSRALPYFEKAVALAPDEPLVHSNLSLTFLQTGNLKQALEHSFQAVKLGPHIALYANRLGLILWNKGDLIQAGYYFHDAEQRQYANSDIYYHLGILTLLEVPLVELGGPPEGVARLEKALQRDSGWSIVANTLAWVLATFPDPAIRDSKRAVALAEQVCAQRNYQDVEALDTLGAAYAAAGQFAEAIRVTQVAIKNAQAQTRWEFAKRVQARLALYQAGEPYYDTAKEKLSFDEGVM